MLQKFKESSRGRLLHVLLAISTFFCLAASGAARLKGTVVDPAGAGVSNARVLLRDRAGAVIETRTDAAGSFSLSGIPEGTYILVVEAAGLAQPDKTTIRIGGGSNESISIKLEIAALSDQLVVSATRTQTPVDELGGSVSVATSEDLQRANQSLVSEPLRLMPGLSVVQT